MSTTEVGQDWRVEWATKAPNCNQYWGILQLNREQAREFGEEQIHSLRADGSMLRERELNPDEPFAWKIEDGQLLTKQISRQAFKAVAKGDRDDSSYARDVLIHHTEQQIRDLR